MKAGISIASPLGQWEGDLTETSNEEITNLHEQINKRVKQSWECSSLEITIRGIKHYFPEKVLANSVISVKITD